MTPAQKEKWLKGARRTQKILRRVWMPLRPITPAGGLSADRRRTGL